MSIKREFFSIQKNEYRKELVEKIKNNPEFQGLDTSMIFQRLLEIFVQNPQNLFIEEKNELAELAKENRDSITELLAIFSEYFKTINQRLKKIEEKLSIPVIEKEKNKEENLFEDFE